MRPRGQKPVPTHLKLINGNPGKRPIKQDEPQPELRIPDPPADLSAIAKAEWLEISKNLFAAGLLSVIDRAALAAYCQAYGRWIQAERVLADIAARDPVTRGLMIKTSNGNAIQNPVVGTANKAMRDMMHYATEFGMTPSSRSRISAERHEANDDPAEKHFG